MALDPCFFYKEKNDRPVGIIGTFVDDTLGCRTVQFKQKEEINSEKFDVKEVEECNQHQYGQNFKLLNLNLYSKVDFTHLRGQLGYITCSKRPGVSFDFALLSQVRRDCLEKEHTIILNASVRKVQNSNLSLQFPELDINSITIRRCSDPAIANNSDLKSQLGMIILLVEKDANAAVIQYASWKTRRVIRSVLASELFAFASSND